MGPAVVAEHLSKRFYDAFHLHYDQAVDDLSFEVPAGAGLALLGPNGAGKTTTLYMLLGLMRPTTGTASIFGCPAPQPASRQRVGFLAELPGARQGFRPVSVFVPLLHSRRHHAISLRAHHAHCHQPHYLA